MYGLKNGKGYGFENYISLNKSILFKGEFLNGERNRKGEEISREFVLLRRFIGECLNG